MLFFDRKITPDFQGFRQCILRERTPERVHFFEFFQDAEIKDVIDARFSLTESLNKDDPRYAIKREIAIQSFLGYDIFKASLWLPFPMERKSSSSSESADIVACGPIGSWKDFEEYPWPKVSDMDLTELEWLDANGPENMKCFCDAPVGLYKYLIGYEAMYYLSHDDPQLFQAVLDKLLSIYSEFCRNVISFDCVGAILTSDDMGHKTQTFFQPTFIREKILPLHKACADIAHASGKLHLMHSCGNLESIMPDFIDYVKVDAKHSFEDGIVPVEIMKKRWGDSISLLGGLDIDALTRGDEKSIRSRTRKILEICHPGGGYCLGSGNSIAKYVPIENYLIMLDEGRRYGI